MFYYGKFTLLKATTDFYFLYIYIGVINSHDYDLVQTWQMIVDVWFLPVVGGSACARRGLGRAPSPPKRAGGKGGRANQGNVGKWARCENGSPANPSAWEPAKKTIWKLMW